MTEEGRDTPLRVAVAGLRIGEWHARAVAEHPNAELCAVCDADLERAEMVAAMHHARSTYTDFTTMLDAEELDGLCIATPNALHAPMIRAALDRGLHVMCDKPLTLDTEEARDLLALARETRRIHGINFSNRPNPAVRFLKEQIDGGVLGRIYEAHLTYLQDWLSDADAPFTWRNSKAASGSGALGDIASHVLDLGRLFVGEVQSVSARLGTVVPERTGLDGAMRAVDVDDLAHVQLQFDSGTHGLVRVSRVARGRCDIRRVELFGERASFVLEIDQDISRVLRADEVTAWRGDGFREVFAHDARIWTWGGNVTHWIDRARLGEEMTPSFEDGLRCQEILDAALRSADERRWIDVERRN
ncbi:MAG: oxidoreductase [Chloroflexi bacterium]|nr:oxidoreductase [Chloroflexota bacterium]